MFGIIWIPQTLAATTMPASNCTDRSNSTVAALAKANGNATNDTALTTPRTIGSRTHTDINAISATTMPDEQNTATVAGLPDSSNVETVAPAHMERLC